MKKYIFSLMLCLTPVIANAQMTDTLGALAIDGMMDRDEYQKIGQMQNALDKVRFQQDLSELITETQISALNGYFDKSNVNFNGLNGVDWNVVSVATGQYYIELENLDNSTCFTTKNTQWGTHHIDVNDGGDCDKGSNNVKLYF